MTEGISEFTNKIPKKESVADFEGTDAALSISRNRAYRHILLQHKRALEIEVGVLAGTRVPPSGEKKFRRCGTGAQVSHSRAYFAVEGFGADENGSVSV